LLRVVGELVVRLTASTDSEAWVTEVTGDQGALAGFEPSVRLDETTLVFARPSDQGLAGGAVSDRLRRVPGVAWVAPVFFDGDSRTRLWVTDEIVVALRAGADPREVFASGFAGYRRLAGAPDQYVATLAAGGGSSTLEAANRLDSSPGVLWATPNFRQDRRAWPPE
jgi:hypothetical protein